MKGFIGDATTNKIRYNYLKEKIKDSTVINLGKSLKINITKKYLRYTIEIIYMGDSYLIEVDKNYTVVSHINFNQSPVKESELGDIVDKLLKNIDLDKNLGTNQDLLDKATDLASILFPTTDYKDKILETIVTTKNDNVLTAIDKETGVTLVFEDGKKQRLFLPEGNECIDISDEKVSLSPNMAYLLYHLHLAISDK